jgi:hypothetical protein
MCSRAACATRWRWRSSRIPAISGRRDELNLIVPGADYGWPYRYDKGTASPEYPGARCGADLPPIRLLPAHAARLHYEGGR